MVFGFSRRTPVQERATLTDGDTVVSEPGSGLSGLAALAGASGVSWSPASEDAATQRKQQQSQPFKLRKHDVKAHLQDRSTAVVDLRTEVLDAPVDVMFDLLANPHEHERIFDAIESATAELVSEEGPMRRWRLDYKAKWRFWKVGGVCENRLWMTTDRERGTVSFVLREPGFLRRYEGTWTITGPDGKGPGASAPAAAAAAATTTGVMPLSASTASTPSSGHAVSAAQTPFSHRSASSSDLSRSSSSSTNSAFSSGDESLFGSWSGPGWGAGASRPGLARQGSSGGIVGLFAAINNPFIAMAKQQQQQQDGVQPQPQRMGLGQGGGPQSWPLPSLPRILPGRPGAASFGGGDDSQSSSPSAAPRTPTTVQIRKAISPKVSPPFPVNQVLKGHACGQVNDMLEGLLLATARKLAEDAP